MGFCEYGYMMNIHEQSVDMDVDMEYGRKISYPRYACINFPLLHKIPQKTIYRKTALTLQE